jgi:hypothetical protein
MKIAQYLPPNYNPHYPYGGWFEMGVGLSDEFVRNLFEKTQFIDYDKGVRKILVDDDTNVKVLGEPKE